MLNLGCSESLTCVLLSYCLMAMISLADPKSQILHTIFSSTSTFRAARSLCSSWKWLQWNPSWHHSAMRDHPPWKATRTFLTRAIFKHNWTCHQTKTNQRHPEDLIFMANGVVFCDLFYCTTLYVIDSHVKAEMAAKLKYLAKASFICEL